MELACAEWCFGTSPKQSKITFGWPAEKFERDRTESTLIVSNIKLTSESRPPDDALIVPTRRAFLFRPGIPGSGWRLPAARSPIPDRCASHRHPAGPDHLPGIVGLLVYLQADAQRPGGSTALGRFVENHFIARL